MFYDFGRNLFSVGLHEKDGEYTLDGSYYDLCMSEARTMSYIAAARAEVPPEHWASLSRVLISDGGYIGLASWSGTAFEYFMPCLFLPSPEGVSCKRSSCVCFPNAEKISRQDAARKRFRNIGERIFFV